MADCDVHCEIEATPEFIEARILVTVCLHPNWEPDPNEFVFGLYPMGSDGEE